MQMTGVAGLVLSDTRFFRYLLPSGADPDTFVGAARKLLGNVPHEIRQKDWGTFTAVRVIVSTAMERTAAFRLITLARYLTSQGPTSIDHVSVRAARWLNDRPQRHRAQQ